METFSSSMLKSFLIFFTPSSSRHLILMFCFSSSFFLFFSETALIAFCLSFGMYFEIRDSLVFTALMNSARLSKSFRIFSFIDFSFSPKICLNATLVV